jgi:hypothetical protein
VDEDDDDDDDDDADADEEGSDFDFVASLFLAAAFGLAFLLDTDAVVAAEDEEDDGGLNTRGPSCKSSSGLPGGHSMLKSNAERIPAW